MILSHLEHPLLAAGFRVPTALAAPLAVSGVVLLLLVILGKIPLSYNLRNLLVRWRITLLTALAFTLVIALQTVMLGFVAGMYQLTEESGQPGNVIVLSDGAIDELMSNLGTTRIGRHRSAAVGVARFQGPAAGQPRGLCRGHAARQAARWQRATPLHAGARSRRSGGRRASPQPRTV